MKRAGIDTVTIGIEVVSSCLAFSFCVVAGLMGFMSGGPKGELFMMSVTFLTLRTVCLPVLLLSFSVLLHAAWRHRAPGLLAGWALGPLIASLLVGVAGLIGLVPLVLFMIASKESGHGVALLEANPFVPFLIGCFPLPLLLRKGLRGLGQLRSLGRCPTMGQSPAGTPS